VDNAIEVRYAGVIVGRGVLARDLGEGGAFVGVAEPLPVGTNVTVKIGDAVREGRVDEVVETADPAVVGMRVSWGGAARSVPAPRAAAPVAAPSSAEPSGPTGDVGSGGDGGQPAAEVEDASGAIPAPMSLSGDASHSGGGKRRRKRR
jgi:hypothetical protein